ncbi:hypothetical protein AtubIFM56815_001217 [Aspergillus tubingensis]|uniref:Aminoglycoside phosphotransferase domain-containing protein n=1 Tax=Aspergillus tubingensis TaxID=5068 RepID=A0A9W6EFY9_ASPTU|nr:hypothetical protein AtubIFM56815_001217 [Aspergillus tubingensis]
MSEVEEIEARLAKQLEEYRSIIQGTDLYEYMGNRVVESRTTSGNLVAVKVNRKEDYRQSEAEIMQYAHGKRDPHTSEMRKHTQPYIGRIGNVTTYNFFDRLHNNDMGPFASEEEFDEWCFARVKFPYQQAFWKRYLPKMRKKSPSKFVLTHGDLSARNIMVQDGQLTGIVDWGYSGFFPEYMEYALATVIHESIEDWWLPVLKRVLEPSGYLRAKFIATIKDRGW